MFDRLSEDARNAVAASADEAHLRGDRRVGTDHLLLGLLHNPVIVALLGITLEHARQASRDLDNRALASIGIEVGDLPRPGIATRRRRIQLTSGITSEARAIFPRAYALADTEKARKITPTHLLCALLERDPPDPVGALLAELKVDRQQALTIAAKS